MGKHHDVLAQVVEELTAASSDCSILLAGSLMRGTEHEGSDIDLFAVVPDLPEMNLPAWRIAHAAEHIRAVERSLDGVPVFCTCVDLVILEQARREPWRNRLFARAKVICDPSGLATRCQEAINDWFRSRQDIDAIWNQQERKHAECKAALRRGEKAKMEFPDWESFANYVDGIVKAGR